MIKKIEDWNYYEVLDVEPDALPEEIRKAYERAVETYRRGSLATYGLLVDEEREAILARVQEAYEVLHSPGKRSRYDAALFGKAGRNKPKARFRKTLEKVQIEEAVPASTGFWRKLRSLFGKRAD